MSNTLASSRNMLGLTRVSSWLRPPPVSGIYPGNDEAGIVGPSVGLCGGRFSDTATHSELRRDNLPNAEAEGFEPFHACRSEGRKRSDVLKHITVTHRR